MTDPERLVEGDDLGAELLRSARALDPERARERKARLIGAAAGLSTIAATKVASAGTKSLATKGLVQGVLAKGLAIGIGVSALGIGVAVSVFAGDGGGVRVGASRLSPALRERRFPVVEETPAEKPPEVETVTVGEAPPIAVESLPTTTSPAERPAKRTPKAVEGAASLAEELAALRVAREALAAGDGPRALGALDAYATRFPHGHLALEAEVVRIEVLSRAGDGSAGARARRFLEAHPQSPYAERLRGLAVGGRSNP